MGIESDQVVYEYLSRVGDVAQQRQLPSSDRMRLVSELRNEIERRRSKAPVDSPAAVRRILARLGSPDEIVAAAGAGGGAPQTPDASVPVQPDRAEQRPRSKGLRRVVPRPRPAEPADPVEDDRPSDAPTPPHLAGPDELGTSAMQPDWWRVDSSPFGGGDEVPGFVGGVEIPELLKPPPPKETEKADKAEKSEKAEKADKTNKADKAAKEAVRDEPAAVNIAKKAEKSTSARRRRLRLPRPGSWSNPLLLLGASLLVAGALLGNLIALLFGWLIAYASRRLTPTERQWAVMVLPGAAIAAGLVWLWGRNEGRWGDPIAEGQVNAAAAETWPWVIRGAALASALFLLWRSQRQR
ncbi:hypothetical protein [Streptomyces blattellae]|uniref:hypothetical protein n=1 Tax=Streptomyces blattellae TaxID=2569855 RepID=UPI0012B6C2A3|nr:hypothetical protein [Streptomyces blattellae]